LSSTKSPSILRCKDEESLRSFSWKKLHDELVQRAPTFLSILKSVCDGDEKKMKTELPAILSAASTLITVHNREMSALEYVNSLILLKGGAKKSAFTRLNATKTSMSYMSTLDKANAIANNADERFNVWQSTVWQDRQRESFLMAELTLLQDKDDTGSILVMARLQDELQCLRLGMHPGYYIVGDNADMRTHVRHQRVEHTDLDAHMFQIAAYKNRVSGNHLDPTGPLADIQTTPFSTVIPSELDTEELFAGLAMQVAKT
jgi:hypothetical protein